MSKQLRETVLYPKIGPIYSVTIKKVLRVNTRFMDYTKTNRTSRGKRKNKNKKQQFSFKVNISRNY